MVTDDGLKQCPRCGEWKLAAECFHKSNRKRADGTLRGDGCAGYCKVCVLNRSPVEVDKRVRVGFDKRCPRCGETKDIRVDFYKSKKDGVASVCIPCANAGFQKWREEDPERRRAVAKRLRIKNRKPEDHATKERERYRANPEHARALKRASWNSDPERSSASNKRNRKNRLTRPGGLEKERERSRIAQHNRRVALDDIKLSAEIWSAILNVFDRKCCFCDSPDSLSIEHLTPVCKGGTNHPSNLAPSCLPCNRRKSKKTAEQFCPSRAAEIRRKALTCVPVEPEKEAA